MCFGFVWFFCGVFCLVFWCGVFFVWWFLFCVFFIYLIKQVGGVLAWFPKEVEHVLLLFL